jgi:hypothetical protein
MAGMVGAKGLGGLQHDEADAHRNREPGAYPELEAFTARLFLQLVAAFLVMSRAASSGSRNSLGKKALTGAVEERQVIRHDS